MHSYIWFSLSLSHPLVQLDLRRSREFSSGWRFPSLDGNRSKSIPTSIYVRFSRGRRDRVANELFPLPLSLSLFLSLLFDVYEPDCRVYYLPFIIGTYTSHVTVVEFALRGPFYYTIYVPATCAVYRALYSLLFSFSLLPSLKQLL